METQKIVMPKRAQERRTKSEVLCSLVSNYTTKLQSSNNMVLVQKQTCTLTEQSAQE